MLPDFTLACPFLPPPAGGMDYRVLRRHARRRDEAFYLDALRYGHHLWGSGHPGRALLALTRALYADVPPGAAVLRDWPLPYAAIRWVVSHFPGDDFPGNPRVSYEHQAVRIRGERAELRRARAWAAWALVRAARPELPGDATATTQPPSLEDITARLAAHGHPGEVELWRSVHAP